MKTLTQSELCDVSNKMALCIPKLLDLFKIEYEEHPDRFSFPCPVHGGDNPVGCALYHNGIWQCWTRNCHEDFNNNIFGFVRGVLSHNRNKQISMHEAFSFCSKFLSDNLDDIDDNSISQNLELNVMDIFSRQPEKVFTGISREQIISKLKIPSKYYINRGFLPETLEMFDVGLCVESNRQMSNRVVVPIYDEDFNYVGCAGRALGDELKPKWLYSKGFRKCVLYGIHLAKEKIQTTNSVILVEGQGDVWRMHEAGYTQTVGIFGCSVTDDQLLILEKSGALDVIVLTDSDEAGENAYKQIVKKCGRRFNYYRPSISTKDVGDMTTQQIKEELDPQIQGVLT